MTARRRGLANSLRLRGEHVPVIGAQPVGEPRDRSGGARAVLEPLAMHAVAGAVDVAAGDALVRLHEVEALGGEPRAHGAREAAVAPQPSDVERIDLERARRGTRRPLARDDRHLRALLRERVQRTRDEPFRSAVRVVALPDDGDPHFAPAVRTRSRVPQIASAPSTTRGPMRLTRAGSIAWSWLRCTARSVLN